MAELLRVEDALVVDDESIEVVNYGLVGCGPFASWLVQAIRNDPSSRLVAAASRSKDKAERFLHQNGLKRAVSCSFDELIVDPRVDVVVFLIPSAVRLAPLITAIGQKKHVICAAPMASVKCMKLVWDSCQVKNVQFMDTIAFLHNPRFKELTQKLHVEKEIGEVLRVNCSVSLRRSALSPSLEALGVLSDLGSCAVRLSLWAFNYEQPQFVKAVCHKRNAEGAMLDVSVWLFFSDDRTAALDVSYLAPMRQRAAIVGSQKWLEVRQFAVPTRDVAFGYSVFETEADETGPKSWDAVVEIEKKHTFKYVSQETKMISRMSRIVKSTGELESFWPQVTLMNTRVLDACRRSVAKSGKLVELIPGQIVIGGSKRRKMSMVATPTGSHSKMMTEAGNYHEIIAALQQDDEL